MIESFLSNFNETIVNMLVRETGGTIYMTFVSTFFSYVFGLPAGMLLILTDRRGMLPAPRFNSVLNTIVNIMRSVPFLILVVFIMPFTRMIVGTALGSTATIVPLVVAAAPYVARMVEQSLQEIDPGIIEAAESMGASPLRILTRVMLPEAAPSLITGCTIATTTILGYSAMAGFVGGGGLGDVALRYGYQRYQTEIMFVTLVLIVIVVQITQAIGMRIAKGVDKRDVG